MSISRSLIFTDAPTGFLSRIHAIHDGRVCKPNDLHIAAVYRKIVDNPGISRLGLSRHLGLRSSTVSKVVAQLVDDRLVEERRNEEDAAKGRPPSVLRPNTNRFAVIVVYCISIEIRAVLVNTKEEILADFTERLDTDSNNALILRSISRAIKQLRSAAPTESEIIGIGLTLPGIVDTEMKRWIFSARWKFLDHADLSSVGDEAGLPVTVTRAIDAELAYLMTCSPPLQNGNSLLIHWGYGIGGAYSSAGRILRSKSGVFCQMGHVRVDRQSVRRCLCGQTGCLETEAAIWALLPELRIQYPEVPEDESDFREFLLSTPAIWDSPLMLNAARAMTDVITQLLGILVPEWVLIYGPFTAVPVLFDRIASLAQSDAPHFVRDSVEFVRVENGFMGSVYGTCAEIFQDKLRTYLTA